MIDRLGSRPAFATAAVVSTAGLGLASATDVLALFVIGAVIGAASLQALAFYHVTQTTAVRVAPDQPARAIAHLTVYGAFSSAIYLPLATFLVAELGWRPTLRILALATSSVLAVAAVVIRERRPAGRSSGPNALGGRRRALSAGGVGAVFSLI